MALMIGIDVGVADLAQKRTPELPLDGRQVSEGVRCPIG